MAQNLVTLKWESYSQKQQADVWTTDHSRNTQIGWLVQECAWGLHIELQAASSFFEMAVFLCNTLQSGHQGYKWNCYKLFTPGKLVVSDFHSVKKTSGNKTGRLVYPPPQEKPKILDLLCHTGVYHFACHRNDWQGLKFPGLHAYHYTVA